MNAESSRPFPQMPFHLAQVNIARMRGKPNEPVMARMVERLDEMNRLAERSKGFVWRLRASELSLEALRVFEDYLIPFEPERLFYNMSVWESVEDLRQYAFKSAHSEMLRDKHQWIDSFDAAHLAMWWTPVGHVPTIAESAERLRSAQEKGPTAFAFTLKDCFPKPVEK